MTDDELRNKTTRTQVLQWFVETGVCDGGGIGHWVETTESVKVADRPAAERMQADWLASGKLKQMPWGELRPGDHGYGLFRIRGEWVDIPDLAAEVLRLRESEDALRAEVARLREAISRTAEQALASEIPARTTDTFRMPEDWHNGYDAAIRHARAALGDKEASHE
jgi:hypothetical protein